MIGAEWKGQEYDLGISGKKGNRIGIININNGIWKNKSWDFYEELEKKLVEEGHDVFKLPMRNSIREHIEDINNCKLIICGDTLGMHVALALKKKVVAIFNCTSPNEIYDYGRLTKVVSPRLKDFFYEKEFNQKAVSMIKIDEVYSAVKKCLKGKEEY
jgi:heptosyltransferase-2